MEYELRVMQLHQTTAEKQLNRTISELMKRREGLETQERALDNHRGAMKRLEHRPELEA